MGQGFGYVDIVAEVCEQCYAPLFEGEEVVEDEIGNYFCDEACAMQYHGITEVIL